MCLGVFGKSLVMLLRAVDAEGVLHRAPTAAGIWESGVTQLNVLLSGRCVCQGFPSISSLSEG